MVIKFNGRFVSFVPVERIYITLTLQDGTKEFYSSNLPIASVHNFIIGKIYSDTYGNLEIINHTNGEKFNLEMK